MYSQGNEEQIIKDYFNGKNRLTLLDVGANDGKTFSNSLGLIEQGWEAYLVEPFPKAFKKLEQLHAGNSLVHCFPIAVAETTGKMTLHVNAPHIQGDVGLLSTLVESEKERWNGLQFKKQSVDCMDFKTFCALVGRKDFDFISIDAEGLDLAILKQIDLTSVSCVCVEHNGKQIPEFIEYCTGFGMKEIYRNAENIIFVK